VTSRLGFSGKKGTKP